MLCCCVRSSSSSSAGRSKSRLKDGAVIATCCISFVVAFAVAMTTIAHGGAKHLAASVSILGSIILVPPVLVSLCLSRLTTNSQQSQELPLGDEETAAAHEFLELEQLTWTRFQEFSPEQVVLGSHQDGRVTFEGYLSMGGGMQEVLVRRLEVNADQLVNLDVGELEQEIVNFGSIRRCNVLPMLGYTLHQSSHLLLFMPKLRSLTEVLRDSGLGWRCRCRVAALTARGLCRLHHSRSPSTGTEEGVSIVHGNIKSENIHLLEEDGVDDSTAICTPYIVDTGLLKLNSMPIFRRAESSSDTKPVYSAPEYSTGGALTTKADVYSFGIVLYVLLSGRTEVADLQTPAKALGWKLKRLMDTRLEKSYNASQAKRIQQTALKCIIPDPQRRPDMIQVEAMLRGLLL